MSDPGSPYKGLIPYEEGDADFFFGRDTDRRIITANLLGSRLTLLYGASGVGKSSVLRAGVEHDIRQQARRNLEERGAPEVAMAVCGSWRDDPVREVAGAVAGAVSAALGREVEPVPEGLSLTEALAAWTDRLDGELLIVLDQFEEYFLYHGGEDGRGTLAAELPRAIQAPDLRANFLIGIREDALAQLDRFKGRIPNLFENYLRLEHLDRDSARDAIEGPVREHNRRLGDGGRAVGLGPGLVEAVLDQVAVGRVSVADAGKGVAVGQGVAGGADRSADRIETPFLQLVMSRLWEEEMRLGSRTLRLDTLNRVLGGAERIVRTHLDATLEALPPARQEAAAAAFRYLVTPAGTKIAHEMQTLLDYTELPEEELAPVLADLSSPEVRVLRPLAPPADRPDAKRYEIFHDILAAAILDWRSRYAERQARAAAKLEAAEERKKAIRRAAAGVRTFATVIIAVLGVVAVRSYFEAAKQAEIAQKQAEIALGAQEEAERKAREAQTQKTRADALAEQARRAALEEKSAKEAVEEEKSKVETALTSARAGRLATISQSEAQSRLDLSLLLAVEAARIADSTETRDSLLRSLQTSPRLLTFLHGHRGPVLDIAFAPDGRSVVSAGTDATVRSWDTEGKSLFEWQLPSEPSAVALSPDAGLLATGGLEPELWNVAGRESLAVRPGGHKGVVDDLELSGDGGRFASLGADRVAHLWSAEAPGSPLLSVGGVSSVAVSSDGGMMAVGTGDGVVKVLREGAEDPEVLDPDVEPKEGNRVRSLAFTPLGEALAAGFEDGSVRLFWLEGAPRRTLSDTVHSGAVSSLAFTRHGGEYARPVLASGGRDGKVWLWDNYRRLDLFRPREVPLAGHNGGARSLAFSPDGTLLATGDGDGTVRLWSVRGAADERRFGRRVEAEVGQVRTVGFWPRGTALVAAGNDGYQLWKLGGDRALEEGLRGYGPGAWAVSLSADAKTLAAGISELTRNPVHSLVVWAVESRREVASISGIGRYSGHAPDGHTGWLATLAMSPDGKTLATGGDDSRVRVWDVEQGSQPEGASPARNLLGGTPAAAGTPASQHEGGVWSLAFSPRGELLASGGGEGAVRFWDVAEGRPIDAASMAHRKRVEALAFSPRGRSLASGGEDGTVRFWTLGGELSGEPLVAAGGSVCSVAFSADGALLATGEGDATVQLWEVASRRRLGGAFDLGDPEGARRRDARERKPVCAVSFSPDGSYLASAAGKELFLWDLRPASWAAAACRLANRNLSRAEWQRFLGDVPYRETCPGAARKQ